MPKNVGKRRSLLHLVIFPSLCQCSEQKILNVNCQEMKNIPLIKHKMLWTQSLILTWKQSQLQTEYLSHKTQNLNFHQITHIARSPFTLTI